MLAVAALMFVFLPALSGGGHGHVRLGSWGGVALTNAPDSLFSQQYSALAQTAERYNLYPKDAQEREGMDRRVLRAAFRAAVVQLAGTEQTKQSGFTLSEELLDREVLSFYADADGTYSPQRYQGTPEHVRISQRKKMRDSLLSDQYLYHLFGKETGRGGLKLNSRELRFVQDMAKKERSFRYVVLGEERFPAERVSAYGKEHAHLFTLHHLSLLTYSSEEDARRTARALEKRELSFEDAVATGSTKVGTDATGKMTHSYRSDVNEFFPDAQDLDTVLRTAVGALSPVVKIERGFAIVRTDAEPSAPDFSDAATRERVFAHMARVERGTIERFLEEEAHTFSTRAKQGGFTAAAQSLNLDVHTSRSFPINFGNVDVLPALPRQSDPPLARIAYDEKFFSTAFALLPGQVSDPLILDSSVVLLQLHEEKSVDESVLATTGDSYAHHVRTWYPGYPLALLNTAKMPWAQESVVDTILAHPSFKDTFDNIFRR